MSAKQRADAEAMRAKYARCFGVPKEDVEIELLEDEDAAVYHRTDASFPRWHLGVSQISRATATLAEWNAKTGSKFR